MREGLGFATWEIDRAVRAGRLQIYTGPPRVLILRTLTTFRAGQLGDECLVDVLQQKCHATTLKRLHHASTVASSGYRDCDFS